MKIFFYFHVLFISLLIMDLSCKAWKILRETIPIIVMVAMIPVVSNDFILFAVYAVIIAIAFLLKYEKNEWIFFLFGLIAMTLSEYGFISTGVEVFLRQSLLGVMPIWLPLLWAY